MKIKNIKNKKAFGLVNASIIIATVIVFSATTFAISDVNNKIKKQNDDRKKIETIYKAMGRFLVARKRLPCPSAINIIKGRNVAYGIESGAGDTCIARPGVYSFSSGNVNLLYGAIPAVSLGLSTDFVEDQYGSKFVYVVDRRATYQSLNTNTNLVTAGTLTGSAIIIKENNVNITDNAFFLIMSYGKNKFHAYDINSTIPRSASTSANEIENSFTAIVANQIQANNVFVSGIRGDNVFDDYIFFKNKSDLVNDFSVNFLIPCLDAGSAYGNVNASHDQIVYSTLPCANDNNVRPAKKCGKGGKWVYLKSCRCYNNSAGIEPFYAPNGIGLKKCSKPNFSGVQKYNCDENGNITIIEACKSQ